MKDFRKTAQEIGSRSDLVLRSDWRDQNGFICTCILKDHMQKCYVCQVSKNLDGTTLA